MAKIIDKPDDDAPPIAVQADAARQATDMDRLAAAITRGLTDANNATGPIKQIPITKYINRGPLNPAGLHDNQRPQFAREYYQNGKLIERWALNDVDTHNLNALQPGRYLDRQIEVIERSAESGGLKQIEIRYPSATLEQRFEMKNVFRTFSELLRLILAEQGPGVARAS